MTVDLGKTGVDSDHQGVEALPRTNLASKGSMLREKMTVQPFPEAGMAEFGLCLLKEKWEMLQDSDATSSELVREASQKKKKIKM